MLNANQTVINNCTHIELAPEDFCLVPDLSIDYAVMENSATIAVVPCNIGWSDIGSWDAVEGLTAADGQGNRIQGRSQLYDVSNCFIQSSDRIVGAVGISNLLIIDTPDALLVADRSHAQDVKYIYSGLKRDGHDTHKIHRTVHRPWGIYSVIDEGPGFKLKRIEVKPGASLSLQMHQHRSEHWVVVSGSALVINGEREILIQTNESTYIPTGQKHRLTNPGVSPCVIIEIQCGSYLGEDDITRFADIYGRGNG
jgi:mannose-1-phosphate guanylyltransferase